MIPVSAIRSVCRGLAMFPVALAVWAGPASAFTFNHGTTRFSAEVVRPGLVDVRPGPAKVNRLLVVEGQRVAAGEVVAEIDTSDLDREMSALKEKVGATRRKLEAVRLEAQSFGILLEQGLVSRQRVQELEAHVAEVEGNAGELISKLAMAEKRLANAEVRAPVAGIVGAVLVRPAGEAYGAADVMFRIASDPSGLLLEGRLAATEVANLAAAGEARVWLGVASFTSTRSLKARLIWSELSARPAGQQVTGSDEMFAVRLEILGGLNALPAGTSLVPGQRVTLSLADPQRSLGQQFLDPIRRSIRLPSNSMNGRS